MRLPELRKYAVARGARVFFPLTNGMECMISEHGVAQVPGLGSAPDFDLDRELEAAPRFRVEAPAGKTSVSPTVMGRDEFSAALSSGTSDVADAEESE